MLTTLFGRLTGTTMSADAAFDAITAQAREPAWYLEAHVPDTIDGRFAVLATLLALTNIRLDQLGERGMAFGVALTERFVTVMESEHRELGLGDPTLGKTVRKLVGSLARRVGLWREAVDGVADWDAAAAQSLYREPPTPDAIAPAGRLLKAFWSRLEAADLAAFAKGEIA